MQVKEAFFPPPQEIQQDLPSFRHMKYISTLLKYTDSIKQNHLVLSSLQTHLLSAPASQTAHGSLQHYPWGSCAVGREQGDTAVKKKKRVVKSLLV